MSKKQGVMKISAGNPLKMLREKLMLSRCELARKAGVSPITVDRIEKGKACRIDTKRRIVEALGINPWLNNKSTSSSEG